MCQAVDCDSGVSRPAILEVICRSDGLYITNLCIQIRLYIFVDSVENTTCINLKYIQIYIYIF